MKKKFFAFVCSAMISINCLTFNTVEAKVIEPEVIKTETWEASYFIDDDYETLYPYLKCIFNVYSNGNINFRVYNTHEFDGFSNIYNDVVFPYTNDSYTDNYYKEVNDDTSTNSEFAEYTPKYDLYNLILGYCQKDRRDDVWYYSDKAEYIPLNDTDIRKSIPLNKNTYNNHDVCLNIGDCFKWTCNTGSTTTVFPDKFVCDATCVYHNSNLSQLSPDDEFFNIATESYLKTRDVRLFSLDVSYTGSENYNDDYLYTQQRTLYSMNDISLAELGSYRGYEYNDGLIFELNVVSDAHKFPTEDKSYTLLGHTVTVPASIYNNPDNVVDKNLTADQQYIHDLERQLNETRSELETYQSLDYRNDGKITALDAQMLLSYYAESIVGNNSGDVSGYNDFINNTET